MENPPKAKEATPPKTYVLRDMVEIQKNDTYSSIGKMIPS
jgi:hypothetical protein